MSLISLLSTLPFVQATMAYKQARLELPFRRSLVALKDLRGAHIKTKMQPFLDKVGIRKDLIFFETPNEGFCAAVGTNMFKKGDAAVLIAPGFYETDKEACTWAIKHEISHIKNNDTFTMFCVSGVCQLAAAVFGMCLLSFLPALGVAYTVGIVSLPIFTRWREAKADDFAIENSSDEELKGGRRLLKAVQATALEGRNTFWKRIVISSSGDERLDIMHPSTTSRIQKIEKVLRERGVELDEATENRKMVGMNGYMSNQKREIEAKYQRAGGFFGMVKRIVGFKKSGR